MPEVATFTRLCSYDRAGMGFSDPGPSPRTARRIARELAKLLERTDVGGPFVLVGASIGAFPLRVFASEHPGDAAGLVLVDYTDYGGRQYVTVDLTEPRWEAA